MKPILLVDDNDRYAEMLDRYFRNLGYTPERAFNGKDAFGMFQSKPPSYYKVIVTDITMETQLAGLTFLWDIRKLGFTGTVVVASTGFDVPLVMPFSRAVLGNWGVHYLVPKAPMKKENRIEFYPISLFSSIQKEFKEVQ
ncbi:MAG: response regulator [Spirochaetia bacterium]|nr:response regulator [Spirochaetia bacterium]